MLILFFASLFLCRFICISENNSFAASHKSVSMHTAQHSHQYQRQMEANQPRENKPNNNDR